MNPATIVEIRDLGSFSGKDSEGDELRYHRHNNASPQRQSFLPVFHVLGDPADEVLSRGSPAPPGPRLHRQHDREARLRLRDRARDARVLVHTKDLKSGGQMNRWRLLSLIRRPRPLLESVSPRVQHR